MAVGRVGKDQATAKLIGFEGPRRLFGRILNANDAADDHWVRVQVDDTVVWTRSAEHPSKDRSERDFAVDVLPYLEEGVLQDLIDWNVPYDTQPHVATMRVPTFICPSEVNDVVRVNSAGVPRDYPANYAVNMGTWKIWDPNDGTVGDGAFHVNSRFTPANFTDGLSHTLMAAEVKAYTPYLRNSSQDPGPNVPDSPAFVASYSGEALMGPDLMQNTGHTEWAEVFGACTDKFGVQWQVNYTGSVQFSPGEA